MVGQAPNLFILLLHWVYEDSVLRRPLQQICRAVALCNSFHFSQPPAPGRGNAAQKASHLSETDNRGTNCSSIFHSLRLIKKKKHLNGAGCVSPASGNAGA
ncbi:hypothetical protein AMECASPLE_026791 [Ameca splendens]|uniref:Secreted protein n=1 Tax=Ameca splendens TaxID=208324 RepID=A0ABV0Y4X1_9TELE